MKKLLLLWLPILLLGCTKVNPENQTPPQLVTGIEVSYDSGTIRLHRQYTDEEKMRSLLNYLRCLDVYGTAAENVVIPDVPAAQIIIIFSDGSQKTYELRGQQFLQQNNGPWHYIEPEKAQELPLLLGLMESDKK